MARDLSNPEYLLYRQLLDKMFAGTPYAHDSLGTRPSFQKTTEAMLKEFFETWYRPNNAILFIVGDVDLSKTLKTVKKFFASIPQRPVPPRPVINLPPLAPAAIELDTDLPYGLSAVAYRLPGFDSPAFRKTHGSERLRRRRVFCSAVDDGCRTSPVGQENVNHSLRFPIESQTN